MYNNIQTIKGRFGFNRIEAKGNISLLDNVLVTKIGIVGARNCTSKARMAAVATAYRLTENGQYHNNIIVTRLTEGVDISAHAAALDYDYPPEHPTIAVVPEINKSSSKICKEIIKNNGLIISPIPSVGDVKLHGNIKSLNHIMNSNISKLLASICDVIIICDIDKFSNKQVQAPYDSTKLKDPYPIYLHATKLNKKIYFTFSIEDRILRQLDVQGTTITDIRAEIEKQLYSPNFEKGVIS